MKITPNVQGLVLGLGILSLSACTIYYDPNQPVGDLEQPPGPSLQQQMAATMESMKRQDEQPAHTPKHHQNKHKQASSHHAGKKHKQHHKKSHQDNQQRE
jgi:hypothetical protein